jgi:hypothetical protein
MSVTAVTKRIVLLCIFLVGGLAHAQAPSSADAAFKRGRELLKAGKFADACIEFEHSQKLDPALGTEFNIAQCSEKVGKLARALELYRSMAERDTNADRKKVVTDAVPKLEARVPHLLVKIGTPPPGFALTLQVINSGLPPKALEANKSIEIDFGEYAIVAKATGTPDWTQNVRIDTEGKTTTLEPPLGAKPSTQPPLVPKTVAPPKTTGTTSLEAPVGEPDDPSPPKSKRKLYGIIGMSVGGAALAGGVVFGVIARGKWSDAKDVCGGTTCTTTEDQTRAQKLGDTAKSRATLSTIFVGAGVVAAGVGVVLFVTAPTSESQTRISAHPTHDGAAVTLSGSF